KVDLADYFLAAWKYRNRDKIARPDADLNHLASEAGLSAKYLATVWSALTDGDADAGPLAAVRKMWRELPDDAARPGCERMRDVVVRLRGQLKPKPAKLHV